MHDHEHDHDGHTHSHDEPADPLLEAYDPPSADLLLALREKWLADRAELTSVSEQLIVAKSTVEFQNKIIASLKEQLSETVGN